MTASSGQHSASASVVVRPRNVEREMQVVGRVPLTDEQMSEEWVIGHHVYLATIADKLYVYDIADPANPKLLDTLKVDARIINDISTTPDEKIGVFTREGASNRKNGIVFLDTTDPAHLKSFFPNTRRRSPAGFIAPTSIPTTFISPMTPPDRCALSIFRM